VILPRAAEFEFTEIEDADAEAIADEAQDLARVGGVFPREREKLLKLPGIGPYTASSLCAFAFDLPGGAGKIRLQPEQVAEYDATGAPVFVSWNGTRVSYPQ